MLLLPDNTHASFALFRYLPWGIATSSTRVRRYFYGGITDIGTPRRCRSFTSWGLSEKGIDDGGNTHDIPFVMLSREVASISSEVIRIFEILSNFTTIQPNPRAEAGVILRKLDNSGPIRFQIVVNGITATETAIHQEDVVPFHSIVIIVVMSTNNSFYITHFFHANKHTRIHRRRTRLFPEVTLQDAMVLKSKGIDELGKGNMEE